MKYFIFFIAITLGSCSTVRSTNAPTRPVKNDPFGKGLLHLRIKNQDIPIFQPSATAAFDTIKIREITEGVAKGTFEFTTSTLNDKLRAFAQYGGRIPTANDYLKDIIVEPQKLSLRVIKETAEGYCVIIDEKEKTMVVIKTASTSSSFFEDWENYIKGMDNIYLAQRPFALFERPNGKAIDSMLSVEIKPLRIKGYWLNISYWENNTEKTTKWIKWRNDDKFMIGYHDGRSYR